MARVTTAFLVAAMAALVLGGAGPGLVGTQSAYAQQAQKKKKGLKGSIGYRRAYSYSKADVVGRDNRRFYDPSKSRQAQGGPFDNGFFFDSAIGKNGGESPYMQ